MRLDKNGSLHEWANGGMDSDADHCPTRIHQLDVNVQ